MKPIRRIGLFLVCLSLALPVLGSEFTFEVIATGLERPTGIAVEGSETLYFTQIPMPGVGGGTNSVASFDLETRLVNILHMGEPEPVNIAIGRDGDLYWTCKSAGVILTRTPEGITSPLLTGLEEPSGITVGRHEQIYFTQIPEPGVPMGENGVFVSDGMGVETVSSGEPEPSDVVVARDGELFWTCKTAGVILRKKPGEDRQLLLGGLNHPTGIALDHRKRKLYFTEVPTPGVPGSQGGMNAVKELDLQSGVVRTIHYGDPEPTDIAVARNGNLYWTCTSAGVIVEAKRMGRR